MKKNKHRFTNSNTLQDQIQAYFTYIEGEQQPGKKPTNQAGPAEQKAHAREREPATIAGLALFLGFNSREEFDDYENAGKFALFLQRARLRIEASYEKKLDTSTGAIFALKSMGWGEKNEPIKPVNKVKSIKIKIIESGPQPVSTEKEVML